VLTDEAQRVGATTTDPAADARAVDAGVKVDPRTGQITERGPAGPEVPTETVTADAPLFVKVGDRRAGVHARHGPAPAQTWPEDVQENWRQAVGPVASLLGAGPDALTAEAHRLHTDTVIGTARRIVHQARTACR
jgi:hypothetical protein